MAAGYEVAQDTRGDSRFLGDSIGTMVSKALAAKVLADKERQKAKEEAFNQGIDEETFDRMFPRGEFFKKALVGEFGGFALKRKKQELQALYRKALLVGKVAKNKRLRGKVVGQLKESLIYSKANLSNQRQFSSQFDYTNYEEYFAEGTDEKVPSTARRTQSSIPGGSGRVSREQIIQSIDGIAKSIERTAQSISQSSAQVYGTLITANQLQSDISDDLKVRNTTLEDKLQKLVDAISNQTQNQKEYIDKKEDVAAQAALEDKTVAAGAEVADDLRTKEDESEKISPGSSFVDDSASMEAYGYGGGGSDTPENNFPKAEQGMVFSGPDSGYVVPGLELHGDEAIVPLDNNYTQGEPSAVDGKVRPRPKSPIVNLDIPNISEEKKNDQISKFEIGKSSPKFEMGHSSFNNMSSPMFEMGKGPDNISINTEPAEPLVEAMRLPLLASGGAVLTAQNNYIESIGGVPDDLGREIDSRSRSAARVFGLPSTLMAKRSAMVESDSPDSDKEKTEQDSGGKSLFEKLKEGFAKFLEILGMKINDEREDAPESPRSVPGPSTSGPGISLEGNAPSTEIPVQENVLSTFENTTNWSTYRETLAAKESGGRYDPTPGSGGGAGGQYEGRYQINHAYLSTLAEKAGIEAPTREEFRANPEIQEKLMQTYTMDNHRILMAYSPTYAKMNKKEQMAVLGYAHSQGAGAAADWVESGMGEGTADQFGTKGRTYYEGVKKNLGLFSPSSSASAEPPASRQQTLQTAQEISTRRKKKEPKIIALNTNDKPPSAGGATQPSKDESTVPRGRNPLSGSGLYVG